MNYSSHPDVITSRTRHRNREDLYVKATMTAGIRASKIEYEIFAFG